ncbi:hypothetical protein Godav_003536 [Gossypium davidsonii]|uniref:Uncharacterized protein n=1 Tax=Gossypium davidsonii TaxID=34287 RepID=A0A7J8SJI2_GOSDV|nr:hypothetical protein [Gossypium davidsonii]
MESCWAEKENSNNGCRLNNLKAADFGDSIPPTFVFGSRQLWLFPFRVFGVLIHANDGTKNLGDDSANPVKPALNESEALYKDMRRVRVAVTSNIVLGKHFSAQVQSG